MRRSVRWAAWAGAVGALASWAPPANAQACQRDLDCSGDLICDGGQCMNQDGSAPAPAPGAVPAPGVAPAPAAGAALGPAAPGAPVAAASAGNPGLPGQVTFYHEGSPMTVTHEGTGASCQTPCTLRLPTGVQWFALSFPGGAMRQPFNVTGAPQSAEFHPTNGGALAGGLAATILGAGALAGGLVILLTGGDDSSSTSTTSTSSSGHIAAGIPLTVVGGVGFIAGIVLLISSAPRLGNTNKPPLTVGIAPRPEGGVSGGMTFSF